VPSGTLTPEGSALRECVLDASVILQWFTRSEEAHADAARRLRAEFERGELAILAPPLLPLEILNVCGRRWSWDGAALQDLAGALEDLALELVQPDLSSVARWVAEGLTAYDAAYVAVAEEGALPLLTSDAEILRVAGSVAQPLT
jgi:predicted nucleic acid-binding protein